jgi:hypothetical protein
MFEMQPTCQSLDGTPFYLPIRRVDLTQGPSIAKQRHGRAERPAISGSSLYASLKDVPLISHRGQGFLWSDGSESDLRAAIPAGRWLAGTHS